MVFSVIPYNTLKPLKYWILKVDFKIQPEQFLNLFLIFEEKFSLVSYDLVSLKKNVYLLFCSVQMLPLSQTEPHPHPLSLPILTLTLFSFSPVAFPLVPSHF